MSGIRDTARASNRKRSSSLAAIWSGVRVDAQAAASSIASGIPSNFWQMSLIARAFLSVSEKDLATIRARSRNGLARPLSAKDRNVVR